MNKKVLTPFVSFLSAFSFIPTLLSLTSCNKDKFIETTMIYSEQNFTNYLKDHHTIYNEPLDENDTSEQIKDYFIANNRVSGKNLILSTIMTLGGNLLGLDLINGAKIKIGYNNNTCFVRLESDVVDLNQSGKVYKSGTYIQHSFYKDKIISKTEVIFSIVNNQDSKKYNNLHEANLLESKMLDSGIYIDEETNYLTFAFDYRISESPGRSYRFYFEPS
jgi:hypothetical protein